MKDKKFDCVKMKWDIQKKLLAEYSGVPDDQAHQRQMEKVRKNSLLGPFLDKLQTVKTGFDKS